MRTDGGCLLLLAFLSLKKNAISDFPCPLYNHTCVGKRATCHFHTFSLRQNSSFELVQLLCNSYSHRVKLKESENSH